MTTTAARVEVLTAEVRVLMVGSRQITLSVYAQLDHVDPGEVDPFGRVAPRNAVPGWIYVVGASARDADAGTLVRSGSETSVSLPSSAQCTRQRISAMVAKARWLTASREAADARDENWDGRETGRVRELRDHYQKLLRDSGFPSSTTRTWRTPARTAPRPC